MDFINQHISHDFRVSCIEAGEQFARCSDAQQRGFLLAFADAVKEIDDGGGSWAMQCRAIVDGTSPRNALTQEERIRIKLALSTLIDHLDEPVWQPRDL